MPIPTYEESMFPMLKLLSDGRERHVREITEVIAAEFNLSVDERTKLLPSGKQTVIANRVGWCKTHLFKAGLIEKVSWGVYRITERGRKILLENPMRVDNNVLRQFPEFVEFFDVKKELPNTSAAQPSKLEERTPEETLAASYQSIRNALASDILENIKSCSPQIFVQLVIELLVKMGYGGSRTDAGQAVGRSGDGGIDGIIKEDRLGLDVIYLQAKRWEGTVSRPEIQKFAGALQGRRARKGVFMTTSDFSREAREFASAIDNKIILIDGNELAEYMIDFSVGVSTQNTYEIKRIDSDYFVEE